MSGTTGWVNPIGKGLSPERIDMGVDYGGKGPLFALGSGQVVNTHNSGWPGGTFLTIHLDSGQYIYYAEDVQPLVSVGQRVSAGQHIANATGGTSGVEIGWAAPPGTGETMAASLGQQSHTGDPGSRTTAFGELMSQVIAKLGGPAGKSQGSVSGSIPSNFGVQLSGITPGTQQATLTSSSNPLPGVGAGIFGGALAFPTEITSFFSDADKVVSKLIWLETPGSWVRIIAFIAGVALLLFALHAFLAVAEGNDIIPSAPSVTPVPI